MKLRTRRAVSKGILATKDTKLKRWPGRLGNNYGVVKVPDEENKVFVRVSGKGTVRAFNNISDYQYGRAVIVGYSKEDPDKLQILSVRTTQSGGVGGGSGTQFAPASRYRWMDLDGGEDPVYIELRQFMPLRPGMGGGMLLQIYRGFVWSGTEFVAIATQNVDLSSYIPTTIGKAALVLITIDDAVTIVCTASSEEDILDIPNLAIPTPPSGTLEVLAAVRVYYGQISIQEARTNTDLIDLRFTYHGPGSDRNTIKVSSNDTTPGYLNGKLVAGAGISLTENSDGGDETLTIANTLSFSNSEYFTGDVSNPPTQAELHTILGAPGTRGAGYHAILNDSGGGTRVYLVFTDGSKWWYIPMVLASGTGGTPYVTSSIISEHGNSIGTNARLQSLNSNVFRESTMVSKTVGGVTYQATAFWLETGYMAIAKRVITSDAWTIYSTSIPVTTNNTHLGISIGIDLDGYLHLSYDCHDVPLKYRRSVFPIETFDGTLTSGLSFLGTNQASVSYPQFFNDPDGSLYVLYREGSNVSGDLYMYKYDESTETWAPTAGSGASGKIVRGTVSNYGVYWWVPSFDDTFGSGGYMHLFWTWCTATGSDKDKDIVYMRWDGTSWTNIADAAQTIPATTSNITNAKTLAIGNGILHMGKSDADSNGHPHMTYSRKGTDNYFHVFHLWHNGTSWVDLQITTTLQDVYYNILRPDLVIDRDTNVAYIIYVDNKGDPGILVQQSDPNDFTTWTYSIIYAPDVGWWEPGHDRQEWLANKTIYMAVCYWFAGGAGNTADIMLVKWVP